MPWLASWAGVSVVAGGHVPARIAGLASFSWKGITMGRSRSTAQRVLLGVPLAAACLGSTPIVHAAGPNVLLVGTFNSIPGSYSTIQAAVDAAQPGDWILVGPGDYHEQADHVDSSRDAGVFITTPGI